MQVEGLIVERIGDWLDVYRLLHDANRAFVWPVDAAGAPLVLVLDRC